MVSEEYRFKGFEGLLVDIFDFEIVLFIMIL